MTEPVPVVLRPMRTDDLGLLADPDDDSPFADLGPAPVPAVVPSCGFDADGALAVEVDGVFAGTVSWHWVQWGPTAPSRSPLVGVWLRRQARGRGIGTAAQRDLVGLFFRHTTVNRVEAHTDVDNVAEQRALEKAGFTREGVIRGAHWRDGAYRDGPLYSILRSEWAQWKP